LRVKSVIFNIGAFVGFIVWIMNCCRRCWNWCSSL